MKTISILSFTFFTFNTVWGKLGGGGAPTSWLIEPLVIDLTLTGCTNYSAASLAIQTPTRMLCMLHESIWLFAQLVTFIK
jgi:hypothetical protein